MSENPADQESHFSKWEAHKSSAHVARTYDAAELARLREIAEQGGNDALETFDPQTVLALIDALEKAQGDADRIAAERDAVAKRLQSALEAGANLRAGRDSAHALLREMLVRVAPWMTNDEIAELRASIAKELAQ